jgi:hypothetical protein
VFPVGIGLRVPQVSKARPGAPFDFTHRYCRGHKLCHPSEAEGSAVLRTSRGNVFRPEESWACGPPKVMKNASAQQPLSMEPSPFPLSSRPERRDLRFRGPFVEMFFDRVYRLLGLIVEEISIRVAGREIDVVLQLRTNRVPVAL